MTIALTIIALLVFSTILGILVMPVKPIELKTTPALATSSTRPLSGKVKFLTRAGRWMTARVIEGKKVRRKGHVFLAREITARAM